MRAPLVRGLIIWVLAMLVGGYLFSWSQFSWGSKMSWLGLFCWTTGGLIMVIGCVVPGYFARRYKLDTVKNLLLMSLVMTAPWLILIAYALRGAEQEVAVREMVSLAVFGWVGLILAFYVLLRWGAWISKWFVAEEKGRRGD